MMNGDGLGWMGPVFGLVVIIGVFGLVAWAVTVATRRPSERVPEHSDSTPRWTWRKGLLGLAVVAALLVPAGTVYAVMDSEGGSHGRPASGMMSGDTDGMHGQMQDRMGDRMGDMSSMGDHMDHMDHMDDMGDRGSGPMGGMNGHGGSTTGSNGSERTTGGTTGGL